MLSFAQNDKLLFSLKKIQKEIFRLLNSQKQIDLLGFLRNQCIISLKTPIKPFFRCQYMLKLIVFLILKY